MLRYQSSTYFLVYSLLMFFLCDKQGKYAYRLCIKVTCVSNAGNLTDAVLLAAVCSLTFGCNLMFISHHDFALNTFSQVAALCDTQLPLPVLHEDTIAVNSGTALLAHNPPPSLPTTDKDRFLFFFLLLQMFCASWR